MGLIFRSATKFNSPPTRTFQKNRQKVIVCSDLCRYAFKGRLFLASPSAGWGLSSLCLSDVTRNLDAIQKGEPKVSGFVEADEIRLGSRVGGRVLRVLRRRSHGLLIIYPLEPLAATGVDTSGPPIISLSLSFPTSDTVLGVEYRVNRVWGAEIEEDNEFDNDN